MSEGLTFAPVYLEEHWPAHSLDSQIATGVQRVHKSIPGLQSIGAPSIGRMA